MSSYPRKYYRNLTVNWADMAGGKNAYRNAKGYTREELITAAVDPFRSLPADEPVLYIVHKPEEGHYVMMGASVWGRVY
ncbi:MAG: hypothetical protein ACREDO_09330 [Methyloceanibacter sp.]